MSVTSDFISTIINNAIAIAAEKGALADTLTNSAIAAASEVSVTNPPAIVFNPVVPDINVDVPFTALGPNTALYTSTFSNIEQFLTSEFVTFFATYFPTTTDYMTPAQAWLGKALTGTGTGLSPAAEDQIWQRERARILVESNRVQEEVLTTWSARSFPLPPGAAVHSVLLAKQAAQDLIAKSSRDMGVKQAEIEVENVRLAVKLALEYRTAAVSAAAEYIKALALAPQVASQLALGAVNAQANLINAASNYFRAQLEVESLKLDAAKTSGTLRLQGQGIDVTAFTARSSNLAHAAAAGAASAGTQAAAALNALHSQATLNSSESL